VNPLYEVTGSIAAIDAEMIDVSTAGEKPRARKSFSAAS